jgi:uncharacterized protein
MYQAICPIGTAAEVRAILGEDFPSRTAKIIGHIDPHCRAWIERCPLLEVSPKGDPPSFVKVLDEHTLAIPGRLGNHRGHTFFNLLENPNVGLIFIVPRRREVVRVSGTAQVVRDPDLLESLTVNGKKPDLALLVRVREPFSTAARR